ncbi:MAG: hypothetical protein JO029_03390 [Candidatus Eremiobacteraeota bacterium]|nr:hypothetical protein [Candidatus Eremiobacteraeota bacterium]
MPQVGGFDNASAATAGALRRSVTLYVRIRVPRRTPRHGSRSHYVSPATEAISISVDSGAVTVNANIFAGARGCTTTTPVTCTLSVTLAPGAHSFDVRTYDQTLSGSGKPQGNVLSANLGVPYVTVAGRENILPITLSGVPAALAVVPTADEDVTGTQTAGFQLWGFYKADNSTAYTRAFNVFATDADGFYILGSGAPAVTLTSTNHTQAADGFPLIGHPNTFLVIPGAYGVTTLTTPFALVATATPPSNSGGTAVSLKIPMTYVATHAPRLYIADNNIGPFGQIFVFDENGKAVNVSGAFPNVSGPTQIVFNPQTSNLFVYNGGNETMKEYTEDGTQIALGGGAFAGLTNAQAVAFDNLRQRLYVTFTDAAVKVFDTSGNAVSVPGNWHEQNGLVPAAPQGILADQRNGDIYLTDFQNDVMEWYDGSGNDIFEGPTASQPVGIGQDAATGDLYVTGTAVNVFDESTNGVTVSGPFTEPVALRAIVQDPANGHLYACGDATVTAYDPNGDTVAVSGFGGLTSAQSIAIDP